MPNKPRNAETDQDLDEELDDIEEEEDFDDDEPVVLADDDDDDDDSLDVSMEVNVEKLLAEMDKTKAGDIERKKEIRRRLEEIQEARSLEDTYSFDLYGED